MLAVQFSKINTVVLVTVDHMTKQLIIDLLWDCYIMLWVLYYVVSLLYYVVSLSYYVMSLSYYVVSLSYYVVSLSYYVVSLLYYVISLSYCVLSLSRVIPSCCYCFPTVEDTIFFHKNFQVLLYWYNFKFISKGRVLYLLYLLHSRANI